MWGIQSFLLQQGPQVRPMTKMMSQHWIYVVLNVDLM